MAQKLLVICRPVEGGNEDEYGVSMDINRFTPEHIDLIYRSVPEDRKIAKIPGCSIEDGTFVTDVGELEEPDQTFLGVVWSHVERDRLGEYTQQNWCVVKLAHSDQ